MKSLLRASAAAPRYLLPFLLCGLLFMGCTEPPRFHATDVTGVDWGKELSLIDHHGQARKLSDFRGKTVVLFFGYTQCPDICPTTLSSMRNVMDILGADAQRIQVLFVTIDPARDTEEVLAAYVPWFHPEFIGLRGDDAATATAAKEFKVFYAKQPHADQKGYSVDHTANSYVVDADGRLRLLLRHGETPERIAADLRLLLASK